MIFYLKLKVMIFDNHIHFNSLIKLTNKAIYFNKLKNLILLVVAIKVKILMIIYKKITNYNQITIIYIKKVF